MQLMLMALLLHCWAASRNLRLHEAFSKACLISIYNKGASVSLGKRMLWCFLQTEGQGRYPCPVVQYTHFLYCLNYSYLNHTLYKNIVQGTVSQSATPTSKGQNSEISPCIVHMIVSIYLSIYYRQTDRQDTHIQHCGLFRKQCRDSFNCFFKQQLPEHDWNRDTLLDPLLG